MIRVTTTRAAPGKDAVLAGALASREAFRADAIDGLSRAQKSIPCKYLYDDAGAALFDAICQTAEYYPTRTEIALLHAHAGDIAVCAGGGVNLIEFGSGSSAKARILLDAMPRALAYTPIDIALPGLLAEAAAVAKDYPTLTVNPLCLDFTESFDLPACGAGERRIGFFPGSTIGNFTPVEAGAFLRRASKILGNGSLLIIGVDLHKNKQLLDAAYNDADGVSAAFNLNVLRRMNRELGANFDLGGFTHCAHYNSIRARVEMHLYSLAFQTVRVAGHLFSFVAGESIHTENSYKYTVAEFQALAGANGFRALQCWVDDAQFSACTALSPPRRIEKLPTFHIVNRRHNYGRDAPHVRHRRGALCLQVILQEEALC